ncbi:hypothetical protein M8C21_000397 [Ambrosia artemisiifolia]|uniref:Aconitase/3-isopropylmalate dehydratase large subunit alpha/beta/alpha domain-containing protein n=1 Tax=Ambrosia artemisiifolia TaxID=4212 RepID=A0AAD5CAC0_AMBAR|nr:hypothetical protein M8C21_000397 [Ambrosia artemisiifolia]
MGVPFGNWVPLSYMEGEKWEEQETLPVMLPDRTYIMTWSNSSFKWLSLQPEFELHDVRNHDTSTNGLVEGTTNEMKHCVGIFTVVDYVVSPRDATICCDNRCFVTKLRCEKPKEAMDQYKGSDVDKYRCFMSGEGEKNTEWRYGEPPNYDKVNKLFEEGRSTEVWPEGSLEEQVQNLMKTWEMEMFHKINPQDRKTVATKTKKMANEMEELVGFLSSPSPQVKKAAVEIVRGLTGSRSGIKTERWYLGVDRRLTATRYKHHEICDKERTQGFAVPKETQDKVVSFPFHGQNVELKHGSVVIAAITSCTNTSNPSVLVGAGLVAKKANELGLEYLDQQGFSIVGHGCTTCIRNSGDLDESVAAAITVNDIVAAAVLSGNRNFEGRVHTLTRANYLASPPLVVAYALAGLDENFKVGKVELFYDRGELLAGLMKDVGVTATGEGFKN